LVNEGSRKTALVIGAVAAAAGVALASYLFVWRRRCAQRVVEPPLRSVSEMLSDLQAKMKDLQNHLAELMPPAVQSPATPG